MGVRYWSSEANFVLTYIGPLHAEFCRAMRGRGVWSGTSRLIRDAMAASASPSARESRCSVECRRWRGRGSSGQETRRDEKAGGKRVRSAQDGDGDSSATNDRRLRALHGLDRDQVLRSHAGVVCAAWRFRPGADLQGRSGCEQRAAEGTWGLHWAKLSTWRSAISMNFRAGYFLMPMDETLGLAAGARHALSTRR